MKTLQKSNKFLLFFLLGLCGVDIRSSEEISNPNFGSQRPLRWHVDDFNDFNIEEDINKIKINDKYIGGNTGVAGPLMKVRDKTTGAVRHIPWNMNVPIDTNRYEIIEAPMIH
jgi:hypothetical protein